MSSILISILSALALSVSASWPATTVRSSPPVPADDGEFSLTPDSLDAVIGREFEPLLEPTKPHDVIEVVEEWSDTLWVPCPVCGELLRVICKVHGHRFEER